MKQIICDRCEQGEGAEQHDLRLDGHNDRLHVQIRVFSEGMNSMLDLCRACLLDLTDDVIGIALKRHPAPDDPDPF